MSNISKVESDAEFILVVEKDTVFQKLLNDNIMRHIPVPFILLTVV